MRVLHIFKHFQSLIVAIVVLMLFISGCGGGDDVETITVEEDPVLVTLDGWNEFEDLNYPAALELFEDAIELDKFYTDAYAGLGWSKYMLGDNDNAIIAWNEGLSVSSDYNDLHAGLAFVAYDKGQFETCIERCERVILSNPSYSFTHQMGSDVQDLYWTIAKSYYLIASFGSAYDTVLIINPHLELDLYLDDGGWDSEAIYTLAQEIERLEEIIRG
ncbi:MAG: hypothetical protein P9L92_02490 [Candidatus Electryonea clarkiae]|nr:hypothetical protein [Candidatus Electryonea clarkiae]MDP8285865.1 hypothetical protein [Candidatus Electryonea clarkiae]